jgi:hypothetical protein
VWTRRLLLATFFFLAVSVPTRPQKTSTPEETISRIIDLGVLEGHDNKVIGGTGDAAAVTITKVVSGRSLSPNQIDRVLIALNMAFGGVTSGPDAEPKTALFVLLALDLSTNDAQLHGRIAKTRKYVEEEFSKSLKLLPQI